MRPTIRRVNLLGLSVRARLGLIQSLLILALATTSVVAWHVIDQERHSGQILAKLNRAERSHLDADMMHDELQSDADAALLVETGDSQAAGDVLASMHEHTREYEQDLEALQQADLDPDIRLNFSKGIPLQRDYIALAGRLVVASVRDHRQGLALAPSFNKHFEEVLQANDKITEQLAGAVEAAELEALQEASTGKFWIAVTGILAAALAGTFVALISSSIRRSLRQVCDAARALATGNLSARSDVASNDEVGELAVALNKMADDLQNMVDKLLAEADRDAFGVQLTQALEMAESESDVHAVVGRAMPQIAADLPMELLLSGPDSPKLRRVAESPSAGAPCCGVEALSNCVAVRRGTPISFEDSDALNACPRLRQRPQGSLSATCVPVGFMGRSTGVLHAIGPVQKPYSPQQLAQLAVLGSQAGARIGALRAYERARLHAYTDGLTGLSNRRALEPIIQDLVASGSPYSVVLADLDHFKALNDSHGHEAGDKALRLFAEVLRKSVRDTDHVARWGGEEFLVLLPSAPTTQVGEIVERIRADLAESILLSDGIPFTASFGIADSTANTSFEDVIRVADEALYDSKRAGRDRATFAAAMTTGSPSDSEDERSRPTRASAP